MTNSTTTTFRTDIKTKQQAARIFEELGLDMTTAINIFLRAAIREGGFPFEVKLEQPNAATLAAFAEGEAMLSDPNAPRFNSLEELWEDLDS